MHFNSRPYVRGDPPAVQAAASSENFNSRPYVRGDKLRHDAGVDVLQISIHAPT